MRYLDKLSEARKPSTKDILRRRAKAREYRANMLKRIKAGLDTEPAKQTGRIPGPPPGEKLKAEAYIQLGDTLAEAMLGEEDKASKYHQGRMADKKILQNIVDRSKVLDKAEARAREGEEPEKPSIRGRVSNALKRFSRGKG